MPIDPPIPMVDLQGEVAALWQELEPAIHRVLRSGHFILGPEVEAFEAEFAEYLGVEHAIGVNSGSDALVIALQSLGISRGDEVITSPFTFVATGSAILRVGATPVFADVEPDTYNLDVSDVKAKLTGRTRAVLPVHLFGHAADMAPLLELAADAGLHVVEDVAQALSGAVGGKKLGTLAEAAAFSFFPSKNLGAYGDGGMVVFRDPAAAETARMLRAHGAKRKYHNQILGYNSRLDALQAAILRTKLPYLDDWTRARNEAAHLYDELLRGLPVATPSVRADCIHAFHQYTVRIEGGARDRAQTILRSGGIASMVYYPVLLCDMPLFDGSQADCPTARRVASEVLSLPLWPGMSRETQQRIADGLAVALSSPS